jgi:hypothetical protein
VGSSLIFWLTRLSDEKLRSSRSLKRFIAEINFQNEHDKALLDLFEKIIQIRENARAFKQEERFLYGTPNIP